MAGLDCPHEESSLGLQCIGSLTHWNHTDWRKEHEQKRRSPPLQHKQQDLEVSPLNEPTTCLTQVFLLLEQNICDWRRLRYELWSLWHSREQVELHIVLQFASWQLALLILLFNCNHWLRDSWYGRILRVKYFSYFKYFLIFKRTCRLQII